MNTNNGSATGINNLSAQQPPSKPRRTFIRDAVSGALVALLSSSGLVMANETAQPKNPFILLLKGIYQPVANGPDLGLSAVNLSDGTYSRTKIYPVFGVSGSDDDDRQDNAIGNFFVQIGGSLCAYQLPGGAIAMRFLPSPGFTAHPDGHGGNFLEGTFELTVLQATGVFRAFQGGHNHMVDRLHQLTDGHFDEFCFCIVSQYPFP